MKDYLKTYTVTLKTKGPVFVGSGYKIGKKEYVLFNGKRKVLIMDMKKMYPAIRKKRLERDFIDFYLNNTRDSLYQWLQKKGIPEKEYIA